MVSNLRWWLFCHIPFMKLRLVCKDGVQLFLQPEQHYRLTGGHLNVRIEDRKELEDFCKLYGCKVS